MQFEFPKHQNSIIKVVGVGGGGGNAVNNMFEKGIEGVDFMVCNTDMQALNNSDIPIKIRLGAAQTEGLGAGANPEVGRKAAVESIDEVHDLLGENTKMVFITAGLGGGTGTGAAPVISRMAKENGILTVGIVTTPFKFEGPKRTLQAEAGLKELEEFVDTLIVIDNNNLHKILGSNITMRKAFEEADKVLCDAARGIAEIITTEGYINVDFADVCTIMREGGRALMGTAVAEGEGRATQAVQEAINSPLLENNGVVGSRAIIVNITASEDSLRMDETTAIVEQVQESAGMDANIIYGIVYDEAMADSLRVTVIATRFEDKVVEQHVPAQAQQVVKEPLRASLEENYPQRDAQRRLDRREREERIKRLNSKVYDLHDPESLNGLESTPAYLRKRVTLDMDVNESPKYSRTSVDEDFDNSYRLRENNSFLHDNVD